MNFYQFTPKNFVADCIIKANENGVNNFNIFLPSEKSYGIPKGSPRKIQEEIKDKISNFACIKDIKLPATAVFFFFHGENLECAIDICNLNVFRGFQSKVV